MDANIVQNFNKRAKRKYINYPLLKHLSALDSPLKEKYISSFSCSSGVIVSDGKTRSKYCKRPWCNICNSIKTAIRIRNNQERLDKIAAESGLSFTTLTVPNIPADKISTSIYSLKKNFQQFRNTYKKKTGQTLAGTYSVEVTYNPRTKTYHPHLHILHAFLPLTVINCGQSMIKKEYEDSCIYFYVSNISYANPIILYHLAKCPDCSPLAQDTRLCFNIIEAFKYSAKGIGTVKILDESTGKITKQPVIYVQELDKIYQAIESIRMFQPFGFDKQDLPEIDENNDKEMDNLQSQVTDVWDGVYTWSVHDWYCKERREHVIDLETGEIIGTTWIEYEKPLPLAGFNPNKTLRNKHEKLTSNSHYPG